jgi:hypothetical protein
VTAAAAAHTAAAAEGTAAAAAGTAAPCSQQFVQDIVCVALQAAPQRAADQPLLAAASTQLCMVPLLLLPLLLLLAASSPTHLSLISQYMSSVLS